MLGDALSTLFPFPPLVVVWTGLDRPQSAQEIAHAVLHTVFMGTENSSKATRTRAAALAGQIGAFHYSITIDAIVSAVLGVFRLATGQGPKYVSQGGGQAEDLALQNIQVRACMRAAVHPIHPIPWHASPTRRPPVSFI